jgi:hypothetical protein
MKMTEKNSGQKIYHIYAEGKCIYHSLKEEEFNTTWTALNRLAELVAKDADLSYEELVTNKKIALESSH